MNHDIRHPEVQSHSVDVRERLVWLDYARGIGITLVVVGHSILGLKIDLVGPRLNGYLDVVEAIYTFHMPLFFFISGYLFDRRLRSSNVAFFRGVAVSLVVPYLLWSSIFVVAQNLFPAQVNHRYDLDGLFRIWTTPIGHMWFLYTLIIVEIIFYIAHRALRAVGLVVVGGLFLLAYITSLDRYLATFGILASSSVYFGLGILASSQKLKGIPGAYVLLACGAAAAFWIVFALIVDDMNGLPIMAALVAVAGIVMTVGFSSMLPTVNSLPTKILAQLGQASMAIFVAHTIFSAGLRSILYMFGVFNCDLHVLLGTVVGLTFPTLLFVWTNRYGLSPYVGFGRVQKFLYVTR